MFNGFCEIFVKSFSQIDSDCLNNGLVIRYRMLRDIVKVYPLLVIQDNTRVLTPLETQDRCKPWLNAHTVVVLCYKHGFRSKFS